MKKYLSLTAILFLIFSACSGASAPEADTSVNNGSTDSDDDTIIDTADNCPDAANTDQLDTDGNGIGDACDTAEDNAVPDNSSQIPQPEPIIDTDNDSIPDNVDNCPLISNSDQINSDDDLQGNACDENDDNDMFADQTDNCPTIVNEDQTDTDGDLIGNSCDPDVDGDGAVSTEDCNDLDPSRIDASPEILNDYDDDCNDLVDELGANQADVTLIGDTFNGDVGYSMAVGDFNLDGKNDLMISSPTGSGNAAGKVYIILGPLDSVIFDLHTDADVIISDTVYGDKAGQSIANAGDFNGDGYDDILISANSGVYIIYGQSNLPPTINLNNVGTAASSDVTGIKFTGTTHAPIVAGNGHVNNDPCNDILIGNSLAQEAYLIYGAGIGCASPALSSIAPVALSSVGVTSGSTYGSHLTSDLGSQSIGLGSSVNFVNDMDGDGYDEVMVGAESYSEINHIGNSGIIYLVYGNNVKLASGSLKITSKYDAAFFETVNGAFLNTIEGIGDFNKDGYNDVAIGAPGAYNGSVYIIYGGATRLHSKDYASQNTLIVGNSDNDNAGASIAGLDDGHFAIGSYRHNSATGAVNIVASTDFNPFPYTSGLWENRQISGGFQGDSFGFSLTSGDLNNDGHKDLVVSAIQYNIGIGGPTIIANAGAVMVFYSHW
jgi:hypothetical protein